MTGLIEQFEQVFREDGLGRVDERLAVLRTFLNIESHVTAHELTDTLREQAIFLDEAYVRSVMSLFCRYGLASERQFQGRDTVYEHKHLGQHHDHLICVRCGAIQEFSNPNIEEQQHAAAHSYGFRSLRHRLEIYGLCSKCALPVRQAFPLEMASAGEQVAVVEVRGGQGMQKRLLNMGIRPGVELWVLNSGHPGPFLVAMQDTRVALGHGMAHRVMVVPKDEA